MRKVITNYKGTKITGKTVQEVISTILRLQEQEREKKVNHIIFR